MLKPQLNKRRIDVKTLPHVEVGWLDAAVNTEFDGKPENLPIETNSFLRSSGFLLLFTREKAILARDIEDAEGTVRWIQSIPKPYIDYIKLSNTETFLYQRKKKEKKHGDKEIPVQ